MTEADDFETVHVPVTFTVTEVEPCRRGRLMAVATVRLDLAGIEMTIAGITMRRAEQGNADITLPEYRHPVTGEWRPALDLPREVMDGISREIAERVTGRPARLVA